MEKTDNIRDRLLSHLPQAANLVAYREEVASTLARNDKRLRIEKWGMAAMWLVAVGVFTACVMKGERWLDTPTGHFMEFVVLLLLVTGAVEVLKHFVNRTRVELLKEVKQVQLQVLELQASIQKSGNAAGL
ncbi:MAG TPA: hypothetical protein VF865_04860 [Acidobacteriaceae bacterium]